MEGKDIIVSKGTTTNDAEVKSKLSSSPVRVSEVSFEIVDESKHKEDDFKYFSKSVDRFGSEKSIPDHKSDSESKEQELANKVLNRFHSRHLEILKKSTINVQNEEDKFSEAEEEGLNHDQKEILKNTKCLFRANGKCKVKWDFLIMILAIWNCFTIPVQVAFDPPFMRHTAFTVQNSFIDFFFFVDILVNFRTSFFHPRTGVETLEPKVIA